MTSKATKINLKNAKQCIQAKDFKKALDHCQAALETDENNYNALVFSGLCQSELRQFDLAAKAYHEATNVNPEQLLAYQGIVSLYTKHKCENLSTDERQQLINAYLRLIDLNLSDTSKLNELEISLTKAYCLNEQYDLAFVTIKKLFDHKSNLSILVLAVDVLKKAALHHPKLIVHSEMIINFSKTYCLHPEVDLKAKEDCLGALLLYLNCHQLLLEQNLSSICKLTEQLVTAHPNSTVCAEILMQVAMQTDFQVANEEIVTVVQQSYNGAYKQISEGSEEFAKGLFQQAATSLQEGLGKAPDYIPGWVQLCQAQLKLHQGILAEKNAKSALQECRTQTNETKEWTWLVRIQLVSELKIVLTKCLADSMAMQHDPGTLKLAKSTYEKLLKLDPSSEAILLGLINVNKKLNNLEGIKACLAVAMKSHGDDPDFLSWSAYHRFMVGEKEEAICELQRLSEAHSASFLATFFCAKLMWDHDQAYRKDRTKCLTLFLKAAKLDPHNSEVFLHLGHFYKEVAHDASRAKKCYLKARALDKESESAGAAVADVYVDEGNYPEAISLYEGVTNSAPPGTCKWAWLRLGLCRLKMKEAGAAIKCFLAALRADSEDHICWECLGEGYMNRGSYTAAWKAFNKAHQLCPTSVYSVYQMASVKQILGQHSEAVSEFEDVLVLVSDYVPALKGLSESHLAIARQMLCEGRDRTCLDHLEAAAVCLVKAATSSGEMSCLWKLLGDCFTTVHPLHTSQVQLSVPVALCPQHTDEASQDAVILCKSEALRLGAKCYSRSISLRGESASLWYDLGVNLFRQAKAESDLTTATELAEKSILTLQKALALDPDNYMFWNSLGVVAASKFIENWSLAQHALIRSIECESNNSGAWSNLGCLYLQHSHIELAHKSFKVAQSLEPSFPNSWIGQALVAESIGSEETMDLFRHATELGLHGQAAAGYAFWVCQTLSECVDRSSSQYKDSIHDVNAVSTALTHLSKFCARNPDCAWALTLYGYLLEESSLNRSALDVYRRAVDACRSELDSGDSSFTALLRKAKGNYARMLRICGKYSEALEIYNGDPPTKDFHEICAFALTQGKLGNNKQAMDTYERLTSSDKEKAHVAVAMASVSWKMGKLDEAKKLLEPWLKISLLARQVQAAIVNTLILELAGNLAVTLDASQLFDPTSTDRDVTMRDCLITTAALLRRDPTEASRLVQKYINRFPGDWRFRALLCQLVLVHVVDSAPSLAPPLAASARLAYVTDDVSSSVKRGLLRHSGTECREEHELISMLTACSALSSGTHNFGSKKKTKARDALKESQRLAHCHPYSATSWALVSAACHANDVYSRFAGTPPRLAADCQRLATFVTKQSNVKAVRQWALKQSMLSLVGSRDYDEVAELAPEVDGDGGDMLATLAECAQEFEDDGKLSKTALDEVRTIASSRAASLSDKMIAAHIFVSCSLLDEAAALLRETLRAVKTSGERRRVAVRMFAVAWRGSQVFTDGDDGAAAATKWSALAAEALGAIKAEGESPNLNLLEGLCRYLEKNHRKCRVALTKVLNGTSPTPWCVGKSMAACYLYRILHQRNDRTEIEKLLEGWRDDPLLKIVMERLPAL